MRNFNTNTANEQEWLTPPALISSLGEFDLDPCAPPESRRIFATAKTHFSKEEHGDGLLHNWFGRVWLNPPYGRETFKWLEKLAEHKNGLALIFARTETAGFHAQVWAKALGVFFFAGRIAFYDTRTGEAADRANAPSCLVAYDLANVAAISRAKRMGLIKGHLVALKPTNLAYVDEGLRNCENCDFGARLYSDVATTERDELRAEIERKDALIEQMREAISDVLRHAEPPQHDIRGCIRANCWWCYAIRARDAALSAAERGEG